MYRLYGKSYFETITEGKLALLHDVSQSDIPEEQKAQIMRLIQSSIESHENKEDFLSRLKTEFPSEYQEVIQQNLSALERSIPNILSTADRNEQAVIGAVDTFLPTQLYLDPTQKMKDVTGKVSSSIASTLRFYQQNNYTNGDRDFKEHFKIFAMKMIFEFSSEYPGVFTLEELNAMRPADQQIKADQLYGLSDEEINFVISKTIERLEDPNTEFYKIMDTQAAYGFSLLKNIPMVDPSHDVVQSSSSSVNAKVLAEYCKMQGIDQSQYSMQDFLNDIRNPDPQFDPMRKFVSDNLMYQSDLYQCEKGRGRGDPDLSVGNRKTKLGSMRGHTETLDQGIPDLPETLPRVDWSRCKFEKDSRIVNSMVEHETPFIASYSGTTSLLMNLMIQSNACDSKEEQQVYLTAVMSYIVSIGHHSIHEVLGPVTYCLDMFEQSDYPMIVPNDKANLGAPPRYDNFYSIATENDEEFELRHRQSWNRFRQWYQHTYKPNYRPPTQEQLIKGALEQVLSNGSPEAMHHLNQLSIGVDDKTKSELDFFLTKIYFEEQRDPERQKNFHFLRQELNQKSFLFQQFEKYDKRCELSNLSTEDIKVKYDGFSVELSSDKPFNQVTEQLEEILNRIALDQSTKESILNKARSRERNNLLISNEETIEKLGTAYQQSSQAISQSDIESVKRCQCEMKKSIKQGRAKSSAMEQRPMSAEVSSTVLSGQEKNECQHQVEDSKAMQQDMRLSMKKNREEKVVSAPKMKNRMNQCD